jgi:hypothetical protein
VSAHSASVACAAGAVIAAATFVVLIRHIAPQSPSLYP